MKRLAILILLILFCLGTGEGVYYFRKGFSFRRIQYLNRKPLVPWNEQAAGLLDQEYRFLGRGRQCFAFASADGKYVLKIPRTDVYTLPLCERVFSSSARKKELIDAQVKKERLLLESVKISLNELQEETGVIAIHWGQREGSGKILKLFDPLGIPLRLSQDKTTFILQHRFPLLMERFQTVLATGDREEAKRILSALAEVVIERAKKGVLNRDGSFLRNFGYDGQKAYQIDIGSFFHSKDEANVLQHSVDGTMNPIRLWLSQKDPEMAHYLESKITPI